MIRKLLALPNDDTRKILFVALSLCLVCSLVVSATAVYLRPLQEANRTLDRKDILLEVAGLLTPGANINRLYAERIESRVVDLVTGEFADQIDADDLEQRAAETESGTAFAPVYIVRDRDKLARLILPIHGNGLYSTMYGFLALEPDLQTVGGIKFYDHGETPGLGGEIDNPAWQAKWVGKQIYDESGTPRLRVIKGPVDATSPDAPFQVDGISGATLTGDGVTDMLAYWLGENGFREFLVNLQLNGV
jgi:Na+-transporting NADH:ubiquinone oxidoreductase subunit C